jgi:hypothetical protein
MHWTNNIDWNAVSALANVALAITSVFGLGFIYLQLVALTKQENDQNDELKLNHYSEYTKRYQYILEKLPSNIGSSSFKLTKSSAPEKEIIMRAMRAYFDLCYEEWDLHSRKLIDSSSWLVWEDGMKKTLHKQAFRDAWTFLTKEDSEYGTEFTNFFEALKQSPSN